MVKLEGLEDVELAAARARLAEAKAKQAEARAQAVAVEATVTEDTTPNPEVPGVDFGPSGLRITVTCPECGVRGGFIGDAKTVEVVKASGGSHCVCGNCGKRLKITIPD